MLTLDKINLDNSFRDRLRYALFDHEQIKQVELVFNRYLFGSLASFPLIRHTNKILRADQQQEDDKFNFDEAMLKMAVDSGVGGYLGQMLRSYIDAYPRQREFRLTANASAVLYGASRAAGQLKGEGEDKTRHLKEARKTAFYRFLSDSVASGSALDRFMKGDLDLSPDNIRKVHESGAALADICAELADMRARYSVMEEKKLLAETGGKGVKEELKSLLNGRKVETAEDAQLFMSSLSVILLQAAKPLGTERFTPDDEVFLPPEEAVKYADFIGKECARLGLHFNVATGADTPKAFEDLPEGALLRMGENGKPQKLSLEENLAFVQALQEWMEKNISPHKPRMLEFIDQHFTSVEEAITGERARQPDAAPPLWSSFEEAAEARNAVGGIWKENNSFRLSSMLKEGWEAVQATAKFVFRKEAVYETKKLFNRAAAGSVVVYPIKIADELLKNFLREGKGLSRLKERKNGQAENTSLFDNADVKGIVDSTNIRHLVSPLTSSVGTVGMMESVRARDAVAAQKADNLAAVSKGVLLCAHGHAPQVAKRLNVLKTGHPALAAWQKDNRNREGLRRVLGKKPEDRSEEDYRFLERYFRMVSDSALAVGEEALSPFGIGVTPEKIDSVPDVMQRVLYQPVKNVPDAMLTLSFAQAMMTESGKKFRAIDYVAPAEQIITARQMRMYGRVMERAMARNGWVMAKGGEGEGIVAGEVIKRTGKGVEKLSGEDIITFANLSLDVLKRHVPMEKLLYSINGVEGETYQQQFSDIFAQPQEKDSHQQHQADAPPEQTQQWQAKFSRHQLGWKRLFQNVKERLSLRSTKYEMAKLFSRSKGETIAFAIPSLFQNSLLHKQGVMSGSGLGSLLFRSATYPFAYSYGIVYFKEAAEELFTRKNHTLHEVNLAEGFMSAAIKTASVNDEGLADNMQRYVSSLGNLYQDKLAQEYSDIPAIATKPVHERSRDDDVLMAKFCNDFGEGMVALSAQLLGGNTTEQRSLEDIVETTLSRSPETVQDAMVALSFLHSMVEQDKQLYSATYYIPQDERILKGKELRLLSEFMNEQAQAMGFMLVGEKDSRDKAYLPVIGKDKVPFAQEGEMVVLRNGEPQRVSNEELIAFAAQAVRKYHQLSHGKGVGAFRGDKVTEAKKHLFRNLVAKEKQSSIGDEAEAFIANLTPVQRDAVLSAKGVEDISPPVRKLLEEQAQKTFSHPRDVLKRDGSGMALT